MLSIVIPTLNEEDSLPILLKSLKRQDFGDYEIIIADAGSKDKTLEIAKSYGCIIAEGGLPARGRNNGAKLATGSVLFFLDADTVLTDGFLSKSLQEFSERKLDIASFCLKPYPKNYFECFLLDVFYNNLIIILEKILPHGAVGIMVKKELFTKLNGYDETIKLAEDHDFARRAVKYGKFGVMRSTSLLMSTRRYKKEGWFTLALKFFLCELYMIFIGPVRSNIFNYKFNHYRSEK